MGHSPEIWRWATTFALALAVSGCRSSPNARKAALAEREGRHHEAYELYCADAEKNPSNSGLRRDIARVGPKAARYWQTEGDRAAARGRYADAWKLYMRALEITPDNTALVSLVRNLEAQHPQSISSVKDEWMAGEDRVLASAAPVDDSSPSGGASGGQTSAPPPPARSAAPPAGAGPAPAARTSPPPAASPSTPPAAAPSRSGSQSAPPAPTPVRPAPTESAAKSEDQLEATPAGTEAAYQFTTILSIGDKRFPKRSQPFDGLRVRLLDTDPELDADFEVSLDETRTKRARNIPAGRGVIVRGRSGKWYEVVVLTVVDTTESVRIGVRPYDR